MSKIGNILEGWSKTMGIMKVPKAERDMSNARLHVCATSGPGGGKCENAVESAVLMAINAVFHNVGVIKCNGCGCPVNEKSQVATENCPLGRWADIDKVFFNQQ